MDDDFSLGSLLGTAKDITQSVLNYKLSREIDAERSRGFVATDPNGAQWYVGPDGQLYPRGQGAFPLTAAAASSPLLMVGLLGLAGVGLFLLLKD